MVVKGLIIEDRVGHFSVNQMVRAKLHHGAPVGLVHPTCPTLSFDQAHKY